LKVIAHRGGRGFGTENTLEAMEKAAAAGVRAIETDVRQTVDGRLVVCHDGNIWGRSVSKMTLEELKERKPDRPLLSEVLESLAGWTVFNLEIKKADPYPVGSIIETYNVENQTLVSSFDGEFLREFKMQFPVIRTGYLFRSPYGQSKKLGYAREIGAEVLLPYFNSIEPDLLYRAHGMGLEVYAWTVNNEEDLGDLYRWGTDCAITDRYLEFRSWLGKNYTPW
jgi:glycerophosphoryl diester phosphodiesterase